MKAKIYIGAKKYALYIGRKIVQKTLEFLTLPARFVSKKVQDLKNYLIYGNSVQDSTPTPTAPIEVESVGDRTKNLFDKNDVIWGYHIDANGSVVTSSLNSCSDFIPCQPNTTYTLTYKSNLPAGTGSTIRMHSYDENKNWIAQNLSFSITNKYGQGYKGIVEVQYTTSENAKYTRFTFKGISADDTTLSTNIQLEIGSQATPYEPYGYKIPVTVGGKNLFANKNAGYRIDDTGSLVADTGSKCTDFISVNYNDVYTATSSGSTGVSGVAWVCAFYDKDKTFISGSRITNTSNLMTITVSNTEARYLRLCKRGEKITNVQLELGDTATEYVPYTEPTKTNIYLDQPLRKIGDYTDYIDFENQKIVRNIQEVVLNGSESYGRRSDVAINYTGLTNRLITNAPLGLCDHFICQTSSATTSPIGTLLFNQSNRYLHFFTEFGGYTENFKEWLKTNNVTLDYVLATPTEETIALQVINLEQGTLTIDTDTNIKPSKMIITGDIDNE